jgi:hypothetical protein
MKAPIFSRVADRKELQAEARIVEPMRQVEQRQRDRGQHVVDRLEIGGREIQAGAALRDRIEPKRKTFADTREAEHADGEERPLDAQHRATKNESQQRSGDSRRAGGGEPVPAGLGQQRAHIGAKTEERDLAEMRVARIAADDVPGIGERREDEELNREGQRVFAAESGHQREEDGKGGDEQDRPHSRTFTPSRPEGRASSTASITM